MDGGTVAVNLVTGFLGVGKTTAISHLLRQRPSHESWAVLVNEFGQMGVDGILLDDDQVRIAEVPGGCLCCVASQAFSVGLNRLLREHRPDRLLIEPSGLGHPTKVIDTLTGPYYAGILELHATLCLMDARHLDSPRHRAHQTFRDQIQLADVLVANKADQYPPGLLERFEVFAHGLTPAKAKVAQVTQGRVDPAWLDLPRLTQRMAQPGHPHDHIAATADQACATATTSLPGWRLTEGRGDGFHSAGWLLPADTCFDGDALLDWLHDRNFERVKGVLPTRQGWQAINLVAGEGGLTKATAQAAGRLEIIHHHPLNSDELQQALAQQRVASADS